MALAMSAGTGTWSRPPSATAVTRRSHPTSPSRTTPPASTAYADVVIDAIGDRSDVVVVAQSFGGYVAPLVAERVGARLIVLVAGMVPRPGETADQMFANTGWEPARQSDTSEDRGLRPRRPARPRGTGAGARPRRQSDTPGSEPWPLPAWPDIATRAIVGRRDRFFPADGYGR